MENLIPGMIEKKRLTPNNIQQTKKFGDGSLIIQNCFQRDTLGKLIKIVRIIKVTNFIEI